MTRDLLDLIVVHAIGRQIFTAIVATARGQLTGAEELGRFEFHI